jgi:hypothetical protein
MDDQALGWETWKQAMSYWETAFELAAFSSEAVPSLPA